MNASDKTPVAIALSGGTDSAAAAVMMKQSGLELLALTMLLSGGAYGNDSSIRAAGAIAGRLGIRHRVLILREQFEKLVIEPFFSAYSSGLTPNPCVTCNRELKAGLMLKAARDAGCESMATGHYAISSVESNGRGQVLRARDRTRRTRATSSGRLTGPTSGDWCSRSAGKPGRRPATSLRARAWIPLTVTESQDICFLAGGHYREAFVLNAPDALMPGPNSWTSTAVCWAHTVASPSTLWDSAGAWYRWSPGAVRAGATSGRQQHRCRRARRAGVHTVRGHRR